MSGDQSVFSNIQVAARLLDGYVLRRKFDKDQFSGKVDLNVGGK